MFKGYLNAMGYVVLTLIILAIVGGGLRFVGVFGERVVYENSFQYKKGMEQRALTIQSQIAEVDVNIIKNPEMREQLQAQRKVLEIQLQSTKL